MCDTNFFIGSKCSNTSAPPYTKVECITFNEMTFWSNYFDCSIFFHILNLFPLIHFNLHCEGTESYMALYNVYSLNMTGLDLFCTRILTVSPTFYLSNPYIMRWIVVDVIMLTFHRFCFITYWKIITVNTIHENEN